MEWEQELPGIARFKIKHISYITTSPLGSPPAPRGPAPQGSPSPVLTAQPCPPSHTSASTGGEGRCWQPIIK